MTGRWVSPVGHDRTRPVVIFREWKLTGNDRTLRFCVRSLSSSTSGHNLNVLMTVEIGRSMFEAGASWHASCDWTLAGASAAPFFSGLRSQQLYFVGASI